MTPPFFPVETTATERDAISPILPGALYLTNWRGAEDKASLKALGVTHVAAVGSEFLDDEELFVYWKRDIRDDDDHKSRMSDSMVEGARFCHTAIKRGGCVLVHCAAGMSRSVTICLAYLLLHTGRSLRESFALVHAARPGVWPNDSFMAALIEKEASVSRGSSSIALEEYVRWGDFDPAAEDDPAAEGVSPRGRPRLLREETFVTEEERATYRAADGFLRLLDVSHSSRYSSDSLVSSEASCSIRSGELSVSRKLRRGSLNREEVRRLKAEAEKAALSARSPAVSGRESARESGRSQSPFSLSPVLHASPRSPRRS